MKSMNLVPRSKLLVDLALVKLKRLAEEMKFIAYFYRPGAAEILPNKPLRSEENSKQILHNINRTKGPTPLNGVQVLDSYPTHH